MPRPMTPSDASKAWEDRHRRALVRDNAARYEQLPDWMTPLPPRPAPDEGPDAPRDAVAHLAALFDALGANRDGITALAAEAHTAGHSFSVRVQPSMRRVAIGEALVTIWSHCATNDKAMEPLDNRARELCRALLEHVIDDPAVLQPAIPLGPVIGSLTCDQALRFNQLADTYANGDVAVMFTNSGRMYLPTLNPTGEAEQMNVNDIGDPIGDAVNLGVGEEIEGTLENIGEWRVIATRQFHPDTPTSPWAIKVGDDLRTLWVDKGTRLATILSSAMREAGVSAEIPLGGTLKVRRVEGIDTGKGNPMNDYKARYTPPARTVTVSGLSDEEPF